MIFILFSHFFYTYPGVELRRSDSMCFFVFLLFVPHFHLLVRSQGRLAYPFYLFIIFFSPYLPWCSADVVIHRHLLIFPSLGYVGISVVHHLYKHTTASSHGKEKKRPSSPFPIAKNKKKKGPWSVGGKKTPIHLDPSVFFFSFSLS